MNPTKRTFRPALKESLKKSITNLFTKYPDVNDYFDGSPIRFLEDATRRHIIYFETLKDAGAKISKKPKESYKESLEKKEEESSITNDESE